MNLDARPIDDLTASILDRNPLQSDFLADSLREVGDEELRDLDAYLKFGLASGLDIPYLAECYDLIVKDTLREQMYFMRHGKYRYSSFAEVADSVYFDDEYMRKYMHGLALTSYLWPNHRTLHRYFVAQVPTNQAGRYLEIGPGHGMYMVSAMRKSAYEYFDGIDISPTSAQMTNDVLGSGRFGEFENYKVFEQDFLEGTIADQSYSAVVMGEVLEHVEQPGVFLETIARIATDDAFIFITTPINAPAIDHIYLFASWNDIETLVTDSGLKVADKLLVPYPGLSVEESQEERLPINVAMVLEK
jgi:2-polyprenyl-3-methyl-5-hydroxy-6-metoxy-1,4-benzoquinol methylase